MFDELQFTYRYIPAWSDFVWFLYGLITCLWCGEEEGRVHYPATGDLFILGSMLDEWTLDWLPNGIIPHSVNQMKSSRGDR